MRREALLLAWASFVLGNQVWWSFWRRDIGWGRVVRVVARGRVRPGRGVIWGGIAPRPWGGREGAWRSLSPRHIPGVEVIRLVVLVVRVRVWMRHRVGGRVLASRHGGRASCHLTLSIRGSVSVPPVRTECPRLLRRSGVRQGELAMRGLWQPPRAGVAASRPPGSSLRPGDKPLARPPGLTPAASLHVRSVSVFRSSLEAGLLTVWLHISQTRPIVTRF